MPRATSDVRLFQRWKDRGPGEPLSGTESPCPWAQPPCLTWHHSAQRGPGFKGWYSTCPAGRGREQAAGVCVCVCVCVCVWRECEQWEWQAMGKGQILKQNWLRSFGRTDHGEVTAMKSQPAGGSSAHQGRD